MLCSVLLKEIVKKLVVIKSLGNGNLELLSLAVLLVEEDGAVYEIENDHNDGEDNADTYELPPELTGKLEYDKGAHVLRLRAGVSQKEIRDIFEQDTIPESEYFILKQICFRFADYCRNGFVREPHHIPSFVVDFSQGNYVDCEENSNLDGTTAKIVALRTHIADDVYSVTVMLVNGLEEIPAKPNHCIFQPKISISTQNNDFEIVESNSLANPDYMDDPILTPHDR